MIVPPTGGDSGGPLGIFWSMPLDAAVRRWSRRTHGLGRAEPVQDVPKDRSGRRACPSAYPVSQRGDGRGNAAAQGVGHRGVFCSPRTRVNWPVQRRIPPNSEPDGCSSQYAGRTSISDESSRNNQYDRDFVQHGKLLSPSTEPSKRLTGAGFARDDPSVIREHPRRSWGADTVTASTLARLSPRP